MEPDDAEYHINETDLRQVRVWLTMIKSPTVAYSDDRLAMAENVIAKLRYLASLVLDKLPTVDPE